MTKRWILLPAAALGTLALALVLSMRAPSRELSGHEGAQRVEAERRRSRESGRPSSGAVLARAPRFDETAALRGRAEGIAEELERQQREEDLACVSSVGSGCSFLSPSPDVLRALARCGTVRIDLPDLAAALEGRLGAQELSAVEETAVRTAATRYDGELRRELADVYRVAGGGPVAPTTAEQLFSAIASLVSSDSRAGSDVRRAIARERAGLAAPPSPERVRTLSPVEPFWRLRAAIGDGFEQELSRHLGAGRARELRRAQDGWSLKSVPVGECRD